MRLFPLIASSMATIMIAPVVVCGNRHQGHQLSKHHANRTHYLTNNRHISLFAQPPCQNNDFGYATRSNAASVMATMGSAHPRSSSKQSRAPTIDDCTENKETNPQQLSATTTKKKQIPQKRKIQFVSWAGKRGMLPHQYYSGVLGYEEYHHWLRIPLNSKASIPATNDVDNYFSTASPPSQPSISATFIENTTTRLKQNILPQVHPRHLKPIYIDEHIIVVNKPSGVLSVPGPRRHESVASLAYRYLGKSDVDHEGSHHDCDEKANQHAKTATTATTTTAAPNGENNQAWQPLNAADNKQIDTMIVHRLDRDTSGVLIFARNDDALKQLHADFKDKRRQKVNKRYVALVCGHWHGQDKNCNSIAINEGEIDLPLVRDAENPPFMRVATSDTRMHQQQLKQQQSQTKEQTNLNDPKIDKSNEQQPRQHPGYLRMIGKEAKPSLTSYRILSYEYLIDDNYDCEDSDGNTEGINTSPPRLLPVTRVELTPVTGRTHQLRVHCAAVGHPIVGDSIYGYLGEGSPRGGLESDAIDEVGLDLQKKIYNYWMRRWQERSRGERTKQYMKKDSYSKDNGIVDEECMLCLHAYQLAIFHPFTESPIMFECSPNF